MIGEQRQSGPTLTRHCRERFVRDAEAHGSAVSYAEESNAVTYLCGAPIEEGNLVGQHVVLYTRATSAWQPSPADALINVKRGSPDALNFTTLKLHHTASHAVTSLA
jgi:hypothetical protein